MNLDLSGKRILVTGGTKGVGSAVVKLLLEEGAQVLTSAAGGVFRRGPDNRARL
jgi:NAD(P)-dependent dehydrogenase (short-subunit alcohol dehydrogenase family)